MNQNEMLVAARREYDLDQVQPEVLKILEPGNEFLQELVDQFGKTRKVPHKARVACFYELKSSNVGAVVGKQERMVCISAEVYSRDAEPASDLLQRFVVSERSGCLDLSDSTEKYSLSRTHFNMNKFESPRRRISRRSARCWKGWPRRRKKWSRLGYNVNPLPSLLATLAAQREYISNGVF